MYRENQTRIKNSVRSNFLPLLSNYMRRVHSLVFVNARFVNDIAKKQSRIFAQRKLFPTRIKVRPQEAHSVVGEIDLNPGTIRLELLVCFKHLQHNKNHYVALMMPWSQPGRAELSDICCNQTNHREYRLEVLLPRVSYVSVDFKLIGTLYSRFY
jgi:hypothetical protein